MGTEQRTTYRRYGLNSMLGGAGGGELAALLATMTPTDTDAKVAAVAFPTINPQHYLVLPVGNGRCVGFSLGGSTILNVDAGASSIGTLKEFTAVVGVDNGGLTESGAFGTTNLSSYYGGTRRNSNAEGAYVEMVTPDGAVDVGGFVATSPNAGIMLVTIDGDPTLATELPTAQELVTAGDLASTALVANGGTLNPTDRVIDLYSEATSGTSSEEYYWRYFAKNLSPGVHTVRYARTGYMNTSASNPFIYICGMFYRVDGQSMPESNAFLAPDDNISAANSRWEFAFSTTPDGASGSEWMGHSGTQFNRIAPVLEVDGTPTAWPTLDPVVGTEITFAVDAYCRHPETGTTDIALVTRTYTLNAAGLAHSFDFEWQVNVDVTAAYPVMLPAPNDFNRGSMVGAGVDYTLDADDGTQNGKFQSQAGYLWQQAGNWGLAVYIPDLALTVDNYAATNAGMWIEDRAAGGLNKVYVERNVSGLAVAAETVWQAEIRWLANYFPDGAEGALAR